MSPRNRCAKCRKPVGCLVILGQRGVYCSDKCSAGDRAPGTVVLDPAKIVDRVLAAWMKYRAALDRACAPGGNPAEGTREYAEFRRLYVACAPEVLEELVELRRAAAEGSIR